MDWEAMFKMKRADCLGLSEYADKLILANDALKAKLASAEQIILIGQDFLEQVKEQNSLWPGEIDDFADAARDYLKNEGGG